MSRIFKPNRLPPSTIFVVGTLFACAARLIFTANTSQETNQSDFSSSESVQILRSRGYVVREYDFVSSDSAVLSLIRATNPLFNKGERGLDHKQPVIFLQGTTLGTALALENYHNVRPRDFSRLDANKLSKTKLIRKLGSDPSARNFFFLALNFGHEVWILRRRGYEGSFRRVQDQNRTLLDAFKSMPESVLALKQVGGLSSAGGLKHARPRGDLTRKATTAKPGKRSRRSEPAKFDAEMFLAQEILQRLNQSSSFEDKARALLTPLPLLTKPETLMLFADKGFQRQFINSFNPDFWSFSMDEQAKYDLPNAIDFVRGKTGKERVHLVGLSAGGTIIMMGLAEQPELAKKVGAVILWAPAVNLGSGADIVFQMSQFAPIFQTLVGPFPFTFLNRPLQIALHAYCTSIPAALRSCRLLFDAVFGYTGKQSLLGSLQWANTFVSSPSNELKQLSQMAHTNLTCKFNFNTAKKNLQVYGQPEPPCYDFGRIEATDLFFYISDDDRLVSVEDIKVTLAQLSVKYTLEHISEKGVHFNHLGYSTHLQNARLAVLPTLKNIAAVEARAAGQGGAIRHDRQLKRPGPR